MERIYHPSIKQCDERADSENITQDFSPPQGAAKRVDLVCFVYLVDLVHLGSFVQPDKRDKPNKREQPAG
jgi:hypothetical protein